MEEVEDISKDELRRYALSLRKSIENKEVNELIITKKILCSKNVEMNKNILVYISKDNEVSTIKLIKELLKLKKNVYAPRILNNNMEFYRLNSLEDLRLGNFNILEPNSSEKFNNKENGCVIVPGLLFDKDNNRLGYGCGYFDKYLKKYNKLYKIGVCFSTFLVDKIITSEFDIKMDEVITEE